MTGNQPDTPLLDEARAVFITHRVAMNVASCSAARVPSLVRAHGCRISADRRRVTVFVSVPRAATVLADLRAGGAIAVVFSLPRTHETIQLKGAQASIVPLEGGDRELMKTYAGKFCRRNPSAWLQGIARSHHDVERGRGVCGFDVRADGRLRADAGAERWQPLGAETMTPTLGALRRCFEGAIPSAIATCAPDGTPNVAYLSQVHYVDDGHVALTYQFFNTTRKNILANPRATVQVIDPDTAATTALQLEYLRTETEGPLFENMKAQLAGIASHTGMSKVFALSGSDVYRVLGIRMRRFAAGRRPRPRSVRTCFPGLARLPRGAWLRCADLAHLFDEALQRTRPALRHPARDAAHASTAARSRLYTVASLGYSQSGVGSEIAHWRGHYRCRGAERTPIRIGYCGAGISLQPRPASGLREERRQRCARNRNPVSRARRIRSSQLAVPSLARGRACSACCMWKARRSCVSPTRTKTH